MDKAKRRLTAEVLFLFLISGFAFFGMPLYYGDTVVFTVWTVGYFLVVIFLLFLYVMHHLGVNTNITSKEFDQNLKTRAEGHLEKHGFLYRYFYFGLWIVAIGGLGYIYVATNVR